MSLKSKVKVGNVTSLSSARYCAGMGVDFLGFRIGDQGLDSVAYKEIIEWVSGPQFILEAHRDQSLALEDITGKYPGHYIEINKDQLDWLDNTEYEFILFINGADWAQVANNVQGRTNLKYIELALDSLDTFQATGPLPIMLLLRNPEWLEDALKLGISVVSLTSGDEDRPGLMDYASVADVLERLED